MRLLLVTRVITAQSIMIKLNKSDQVIISTNPFLLGGWYSTSSAPQLNILFFQWIFSAFLTTLFTRIALWQILIFRTFKPLLSGIRRKIRIKTRLSFRVSVSDTTPLLSLHEHARLIKRGNHPLRPPHQTGEWIFIIVYLSPLFNPATFAMSPAITPICFLQKTVIIKA